MKITIIKTVDKATQLEVRSDSPFLAGQNHLVSDAVGELLIDKGLAVKFVRPEKESS